MRDAAIAAAFGLLWVGGGVLLKGPLAPATCRWCDRDGERDTLNGLDAGVRDALRLRHRDRADLASDVVAYVVAPASALGLPALLAGAERRGGWWIDAGLVMEAVAVNGGLHTVVKLATARERPFVHALPPAERAASDGDEDNLSFYSGHTSTAFALAVAGGTVCSLRGYRHAWAVWTAGLAAAAATAYLRIAADRHYASDVLVGGAVGGAVGFAVPYGLGRRGAQAVVTHRGVALQGEF